MSPTVIPHSKSLRRGRFSESGRIYLITTVTQGREPVFHDFWLGRSVVNALRHQHDTGRVASLAYALLPDHLHWLVMLTGSDNLEHVIHSVKGFSARQINRVRRRNGSLWQSGFHDHALRDDEDLLQIARYLVANPLRAGLVERVGDYPLWDAVWL